MRATDEDRRDIAATNARFRQEARRYGLHFRCRACAHVVPSNQSCSMDFPNAILSQDPPQAIADDGRLTFCKFFELGEYDSQPI